MHIQQQYISWINIIGMGLFTGIPYLAFKSLISRWEMKWVPPYIYVLSGTFDSVLTFLVIHPQILGRFLSFSQQLNHVTLCVKVSKHMHCSPLNLSRAWPI